LLKLAALRDQNDFNCNEGLAKRRFGRLSMRDIQGRTGRCKVREWMWAAFFVTLRIFDS
jgi:hypothetical protein